jgi:hypothetical protein
MSDRRRQARRILADAAGKLETLSRWKGDITFYKALLAIADDEQIAELAANFGRQKLPLAASFIMNAIAQGHDPREVAVREMMLLTAHIFADSSCRPVKAKDNAEQREELEKLRAHALSLNPYGEADERSRDKYVAKIDAMLTLLAPLDDLIVERRAPTKKKFDDKAPTTEEYAHARAVRARIREKARQIFGNNGDRVANAFVTAVTGIPFSSDDR